MAYQDLSQSEKQARLISTHTLVPVNRDYKDGDAERAFQRAQGNLRTSPAQEARAEAAAEATKEEAAVAKENADFAVAQEEKGAKLAAKQSDKPKKGAKKSAEEENAVPAGAEEFTEK